MRLRSKACLLAAGLLAVAACSQADETGKALYQRCAVCHQPDGAGIPGVFPALKGRLAGIVASAEGRDYVTMVLTEGLVATITIDGVRYVGAMPAQQLTDTQVANVIQYIATDFGRNAADARQMLSATDVAAIRSRFAADKAVPAAELRTRVTLLNGH